ncbi:MAG TPA: zf-TFIIB domain-containing protein [Aggregatilineales bacterium]|nr:zf-TFIIB domain-containing protein [Aggregatilineales bacterium]
MKCPVCETIDLVISDRQGVEIDYCPRCRGVWLDRGELDKIIERAAGLEAQAAAPRMDLEKRKNDQPVARDLHRRTDFDDDDYDDDHKDRRDPRDRRYKKKSFLSEIFDVFD